MLRWSFSRLVILTCLVIELGSFTEACQRQIFCPRRCPFRYARDAEGCRTCECCPIVRCPFCWRGYVLSKNDNQCVTCHCKWGLW